MPSYSNVVRFQANHASLCKGCVEDPMPSRYIIINSLYKSQRDGMKPISGVHPCESRVVSSESHVNSSRSKMAWANSRMSLSSKCWPQVRIPHNRIAVSTEEASESQILSPVLIFAK